MKNLKINKDNNDKLVLMLNSQKVYYMYKL